MQKVRAGAATRDRRPSTSMQSPTAAAPPCAAAYRPSASAMAGTCGRAESREKRLRQRLEMTRNFENAQKRLKKDSEKGEYGKA